MIDNDDYYVKDEIGFTINTDDIMDDSDVLVGTIIFSNFEKWEILSLNPSDDLIKYVGKVNANDIMIITKMDKKGNIFETKRAESKTDMVFAAKNEWGFIYDGNKFMALPKCCIIKPEALDGEFKQNEKIGIFEI